MYLSAWDAGADAADDIHGSLVEPIIAWCRDTLGRCRRPYGIDHFELVLALSRHDGRPVESARFRDLRPSDLYDPDGVSARLIAFLRGGDAAPPARVAASLFSWGDAAHEALIAS
jgi:hypothetical protein